MSVGPGSVGCNTLVYVIHLSNVRWFSLRGYANLFLTQRYDCVKLSSSLFTFFKSTIYLKPYEIGHETFY